MINKTQPQSKSFSPSSALIIILVLVVVSVAAILVGGGDGFSRKYAGLQLREILNSNFLLAQAGTSGKNYFLDVDTDPANPTGFRARIENIVLNPELLPSAASRFASAVVAPINDNTLWNSSDITNQVLAGYPLKPSFVESTGLLNSTLDKDLTPGVTPGLVECYAPLNGPLAFFEDVAYETGVGFDDPVHGQSYQDAVCEVFGEFAEMLTITESETVQPIIVFQDSTNGTPDHTLSVVAPQFAGGSGWKSTTLAEYLRSGVDATPTIISEDLSVLGAEGFIRVNFKNVEWLESGVSDGYSLTTVVRRNFLNLLGFGVSFVDNNGVNAIQSAQKRWTEWDRLLYNDNFSLFVDQNYENINENSLNQRDSVLSSNTIKISAIEQFDALTISSAENFYNIFTPSIWQKGQSLGGLSDPNAVSHPILNKNEVKLVTDAEKQILCHMGISAEPTLAGDSECLFPRSVVSDDIVYHNDTNLWVCLNLFDQNTIKNAKTNSFVLDGPISIEDTTQSQSTAILMASQNCPGNDYSLTTSEQSAITPFLTNAVSQAKSMIWIPTNSGDLENRELVTFTYQVKDTVHGRVSDPVNRTVSKNIINLDSNLLKNPGFQDIRGNSPLDFIPLSLRKDSNDILECDFASVSAWCAQGVASIVDELLGTWNPFLLNLLPAWVNPFNPEPSEPRAYAMVHSGYLIQKLNAPLQQGTSYTVSGKLLIEDIDIEPEFLFSATDAVREQSSGAYHIRYPELLAGNGNIPGKVDIQLPVDASGNVDLSQIFDDQGNPLWFDFELSFNPGDQNVTHVAFGSNSNLGRVLFDDLSMTRLTVCADTCAGDLNGDCVVSYGDMTAFLALLGTSCPNGGVGCAGDFNTDGIINFSDLTSFLQYYGTSCPVNNNGAMNTNTNEDSLLASAGKTGFAGLFQNLFIRNAGIDKGMSAQARSSRRSSNETRATQSEATFKDEVVVVPNDPKDRVSLEQFDIEYVLSPETKVVPNAGGFEANLQIDVKNIGNTKIDNITLVGLIPSIFKAQSSRFSEPDVSINASTGSLYVPEFSRGGDTLSVYVNVHLNDNICAQVRRNGGRAYTKLVEVNLCESPQLLLERQYGIKRDEDGNIIPRPGGGSGDVLGGLPTCNDGLDNDADGEIDIEDPDCHTDGDARNVATYDGTRTESGTMGLPQCQDGIDNDGDTKIDLLDPGCNDFSDNTENTR